MGQLAAGLMGYSVDLKGIDRSLSRNLHSSSFVVRDALMDDSEVKVVCQHALSVSSMSFFVHTDQMSLHFAGGSN